MSIVTEVTICFESDAERDRLKRVFSMTVSEMADRLSEGLGDEEDQDLMRQDKAWLEGLIEDMEDDDA